MSERKLKEIETMFKKATRPRLLIEDYPKIKHIGVILDSSVQGFNALQVGTSLSHRLNTSLNVMISADYYEPFEKLLELTQEKLDKLMTQTKEFLKDEKVKAEIEQILPQKIQDTLKLFSKKTKLKNTLIGKMVKSLTDSEAQIIVTGVPLFETGENKDSLGTFAFRLLREREIQANFLLVPGKEHIIADSVLAFVSVEQQPTSIVALYRRALSFATEKTKFKIVGIVPDNVVKTVARLDLPADDTEAVPDLEGAKAKLIAKMQETLESIKLKKEIQDLIILDSPTWEVTSGHVSEIVRAYLKSCRCGIAFVRSVPEISEKLDPFAELVTRTVLHEGYNCLVFWD